MQKDRDYYAEALNGLRGAIDDLLEEGAPAKAVQMLREALKLCDDDHDRKVGLN